MSALQRFLVEFDAPPRPRAPTPAWRLTGRPDPDPAPPEAPPAPPAGPDPIEAAVAEALARAGAAHDQELAAAAERFAADLARERARWAEAEGEALAAALGRAAAEVETGLAEAAAAVLERLVGDAVRHRALAELRGAISDLVTGGAGGRIAVRGPADLLDALGRALARAGIEAGGVDLLPDETVEVVVSADMSTATTRLADWARALGRRLEGEA